MLEGGCFCGHVRYQAGNDASHETLCHCSMCRRASGAPVVAWFTVPVEALRFTSGEPTRFRSSDHGTRSFCPRCGSALTFQDDALLGEIDVTTCSLDDPERVPPRDHVRTSARLAWLKFADDLPSFPEGRTDML